MQIPEHIIDSFAGTEGFDRDQFANAHRQSAPTSIRLHPIKGVGLYKDLPTVKWCESGVYLPERPVFTLDPLFHAGAYYVQEASSMFLHQALKTIGADRPGMRVLDLCAAPGGKSTLIASVLHPESLLISNEVIRTRASILEENTCRWGYMNNWVTSNDPRDIGKLEGYFDIIVVDAPCSGSGLWRKDPNALNEWSEENVQLCSGRQKRIIADVWPSLKKGGHIIYATCSYSVAEDEAIADWMAYELGAKGVRISTEGLDGVIETIAPKSETHGYRFFPHRVMGEGFFLTMMQKAADEGTIQMVTTKWQPDKKIQAIAKNYFTDKPVTIIPGREENYSAIDTNHVADWQQLQKAVWLRRTGTAVGMPTAKEWIPDHELALCVDTCPQPSLDVSREQALKFLKREDMGAELLEKGWLMVRYNGRGLGWVKSLGNRYNNYLPKHWRIRMSIDE